MPTITDIAMTSGQLAITGAGLPTVTGLDAIAQHITSALLTERGEIDLDVSLGVPWRTQILGVKSPDLTRVRAQLAEVITAVNGVREVTRLDLSLSAARLLTVTLSVSTVEGELAGEAIADPAKAAEVARLRGISALAAELRAQGAPALAALFESGGFAVAPTLAYDPAYAELASLREYHEWPPLLLLLYPIGSRVR